MKTKNIWQALDAALADAPNADLSWIRPPPAADGWTLAIDALGLLATLPRHLQPRHVLEFGSGLSSRVLARAVADLRPICAISSVDHDPEFGPLASKTFDGTGRVKFQIAPVVARDCGGKILPVYHLDAKKFASQRPVDLALIDGPPVNCGGREGTLYQVLEFARPGTLVLLDDANRPQERAALKNWQDSLGDAIEVRRLTGFTRGMAAILVNRPVPRAELWTHKQKLTATEIESLVPADQSYILVDLNCWGAPLTPTRRSIPFLEQAGQYWGPPADEATAISELERLRDAGAGFIAITWPAFWWLDCYPGFFEHLRGRYRCVADNDRLLAFALRA